MILKWEDSVIARDEIIVFSDFRFLKAFVKLQWVGLRPIGLSGAKR